MLIYNYQKEFLGIDENDLRSLGFSDFAHLRREASDFADFFVKTPGFVHNFKHVHWIDFVTCAEGNEDSKVIIHANGKNYKCTLDIRVAYLVDNPTQKAYFIHLMNLRALTHSENEQISGDVFERPSLQGTSESKVVFENPSFEENESEEVEKVEVQEELKVTDDPYELNVKDSFEEDYFEGKDIGLEDDLLLNDDVPKVVEKQEIQEKVVEKVEQSLSKSIKKQAPQTSFVVQELEIGSDYVYDPHVASDELGLPVDLIEEFIQDFINQANDFKNELYSSLREDNISNLKILSHKLKGVAANLRVEDALEVLTTINTSPDREIIEMNLNTFYLIIAKLSNEDTSIPSNEIPEEKEVIQEDEDEDIILSFKDDVQEEIALEISDMDDKPSKAEEVSVADEAIDLNYDDFVSDTEVLDDKIELDVDIPLEAEHEQMTEEIEEVGEVLTQDVKKVESESYTKEKLIEKEDSILSEDLSYSKALVASEIGISLDSFNELFEDYIEEALATSGDIQKAISENDVELWQRYAVKLKGMSDNMRVHDITAELKSLIHTNNTEIAVKAITVVSKKLEQISKVEV